MMKKVSYFIETPDLDIITGYPCFNYIEYLDPVWATSLPSVTYDLTELLHIYTPSASVFFIYLSWLLQVTKSWPTSINLAQKEA